MDKKKKLLLYGGGGLDPAVINFVTAAGITNPIEVAALSYLTGSLKAASLWSKMEALYPMVGGASDTTKFNLKDPQDTDAAYRIVWSAGGVTFDSTGITGNGLSGSGDTKYMITRQDDLHYCCYIRNNVQSRCAIGVLNAASNRFTQMYPRMGGGSANIFEGDINQSVSTSTGATITDSRGFNLVTRVASNSLKAIQRGVKVIDSSQASASPVPDRTVGILARKTATFNDFSTFNLAYASIGFGLTEDEAATLRAIVIQFETILGRQV